MAQESNKEQLIEQMKNAPSGGQVISQTEYEKILKPNAHTLREQWVKQQATIRALADPLPGPLLEAVLNEPEHVQTTDGLVEIRKLVAYDFVILKKINSPLHQHVLESQKPAEQREQIDFGDDEQFEMIYQLAHPIEQTTLLVRKGVDKRRHSHDPAEREEANDALREAAIQAGLKYELADLSALIQAVIIQMLKSARTAIAHGAEEIHEGQKDILDEDKKK